MSRQELADEQWAVIPPLMPKQQPGPGRQRADARHTVNGLLCVLNTGGTWEDGPRAYGSPTTGWRRFQAWTADGTWERLWRTLRSQLEAQDTWEWTPAFLDGRVVPATKGAPASARPQPARARR